jgi:lysophospholipase L1-like esterase
VIALIVSEGILRLFPRLLSENAQIRLHWTTAPDEAPPSPHRYIGFVPRPAGFAPDVDATGASAEAIWGQRNRAPWPDRADVVAVGDSFTYSQTVGLDQAWTTLLDDALPNERVITLGTIGTAPQQYLRIFETYGAQSSPKLVLVGLFMGNDIEDASTFDRWWREARDEDYRYYRSRTSATGPRAWWRQFRQQTYIGALLNDALRAPHYVRHDDRFLDGMTIELPSKERVQIIPRSVARSVAIATPGKPGFDTAIASMVQLKALAAQHGAACLVLLFPSKEEVYGQFAERDLPDLDLATPTRNELTAQGIDYFDLGPILRERARNGLALYHEIDGHPNARGYAVIAETLRDYLTESASKYGLHVDRAAR